MIEQDEAIISSLEEIDHTFSQINKLLKSLLDKTKHLESDCNLLITNHTHLIHFFNLTTPLSKDICAGESSQSLINPLSPTNPFKFNAESTDFTNLIPKNIKNSEDIKVIYYFIKKNKKKTKFADVYLHFNTLSKESVDFYLNVLIQANWIQLKENCFVVTK